jgi:hypothetical protein
LKYSTAQPVFASAKSKDNWSRLEKARISSHQVVPNSATLAWLCERRITVQVDSGVMLSSGRFCA